MTLNELEVKRDDWKPYETYEDAVGDLIAAVESVESGKLEESIAVYSAVRSGNGVWGTKEAILSELGKSTGRGRTTMNLRYKVGAIFPRNVWIEGAALTWSHYRAASQVADIDDPDTYSEAWNLLYRACDEEWSVRHIEHFIAKYYGDKTVGEDEKYPIVAINAENCTVESVSDSGVTLSNMQPDAVDVIKRLLGIGVTVTMTYIDKQVERTTDDTR